ncbi:HEPN domain-containing protein [Desulfonema limicola]|uniref:HEPN domain-containing protein n=1 Tax=Desulfonema limicola TaxID=45656 RepID=A0A975B8I8_9BACT|nr:HEPN domain-containing protein [Desulfonema limicola]QTA80767.1 HEPN domain-containing protein [Desulfonema limicola]
MSNEKLKKEIICYWLEKAHESLASAKSEYLAGRLTFAMNRAYYSCFYSASAVLMFLGKQFKKHTGVKSGVRQYLINKGLLDVSWGRFYNRIFESRQRADYVGMVKFSHEDIEEAISESEKFVNIMENIISR